MSNKSLMKTILLILSIIILTILLAQAIQMFLTSSELWKIDQILCSMDLGSTIPQPETSDHPVTQSLASTDLTKPVIKP
uniref:F-ORF n=1 Tax=Anodonta anatina TaxID=143294 RepID=U5KJC3_ANOAN|nr:F-ORF [Anodonta anatina]